MPNEFIEFQNYLKRLRTIYFNALCSFYSYEAIEELKAPNIVGENEAKENVIILNKFKFFITSRHALNVGFFIELAKILDKHKDDPISLSLLVKYAKNHRHKFTVEEFEKNSKDREFLQELKDRFVGITNKDLEVIDEKIKDLGNLSENIKILRDKYLAHEDKARPEVFIKNTDIVNIFKIIEEILNIFSYKTDFSTTSYSHIEDECKRDVKNVFEYLKRFEPYRLNEIKEKYKIEK